MKARFGFVAVVMLFAGSYASAAPIVNYSSGVATGISGLTVDGTTYNVNFAFGSYNSVFGASLPTFLGNFTGANDAANAMMAVLNAEAVSPVIGNGGRLGVIWTAYSTDGVNFLATQVGYQPSPWQRFGNFQGGVGTDHTQLNWGFATFTAVPEPASLALMGLGIAGLGVMRRRRAK